ncbi:MAG: glycosyltransferase family 4 protein [Lachnospiraceae bacterium]|nr:glycosyltransferase family 4 protein [Lachnospiraceae bacterium]
MKKVLMVATVPSVIGQFNMNNVQLLKEMGYDVHVACNFFDRSVWPEDRIKEFIELLKNLKVVYHQIDFCRSPKCVNQILKSIYQMNNLMAKEKYSFVHCHTPMAGVVSRLICYKKKVKVIYTAHGFHFYQGAPLKNWLIYYPVEKLLSWWTDILITINREDYKRAKKRFYAKKTLYIPGIGIDVKKYGNDRTDLNEKRKELGIGSDDIMLLSVGELNANKNHRAVIHALGKIIETDKNSADHLHYFIAGKGELKDMLIELAYKEGINLHLLGFRNDVSELLKAADIFILPSIREGLNVSLMEAMACKCPVICSKIRGNIDLIVEEKGGFLFSTGELNDLEDKLNRLVKMSARERCDFGEYNYRKIQKFDCGKVNIRMREIYGSLYEGEDEQRIFSKE